MNGLRKIPARRSRGYVLLLVLLVLTIAATAMVWLTDGSCRKSLEASEACRALQVRWGSLSLSKLLLESPEIPLASTAGAKPTRVFQTRIDMGGMAFDAILWDEQAKANVNTLAGRLKPGDFDAVIRRLASGSGAAMQNVASAPADGFWSPCQLIGSSDPSSVLKPEDYQHSVVTGLTCWGDGRVNFKRAEPAVLDAVLEGIFNGSQVDQLVQFARDNPDCTLQEALAAMHLESQASDDAGRMLVDRSSCHSLWVVADNGQRRWYNLYVKNKQGPAGFSRFMFTWP